MTPPSGWISYTPGDNSHLTDDQRTLVEQRIKERNDRRGALLGVVEVRVYEHDAEPQVGFPPGSELGGETSPAAIASIVSRAREELAHWR
ncbi:MAG TPA: hypothetical protein VGY51_08665 [Acidimicrobiales bacterium]|nr:hypothetical protein [Acidimicrobiales bacterium]